MFDPKKLNFDEKGLIPCVTQDAASLEVLMVAWMNEDTVRWTLDTGKVTYWSRSRQQRWVKGETSGHTQKLIDLRYDCDKDCLLALVEQIGPACHTNRQSCFYTSVKNWSETILTKPMDD